MGLALKKGYQKIPELNETKSDPISLSNYSQNSDSINLTPVWMSHDIKINSINFTEQTFEIEGIFDFFWNDNTKRLIKAATKLKKKVNKTNESNETSNENTTIDFLPKLSNKMTERQSKLMNREVIDLNDLPLTKHFLDQFIPISTKLFDNCTDLLITDSLFIYEKNGTLVHLCFKIKKAIFHQRFECWDFPFDTQFLNIKLLWNTKYFYMKYINNNEATLLINKLYSNDSININKYNKCIEVSMKESLTDWTLKQPWIDFRIPKYGHQFGLIKLRVARQPFHYLLHIIFPLFVIEFCSFASFKVTKEDIGDRLNFLVTVLLTVVAFHNGIIDTLPKLNDITLVDWYFIVSYVCIALLILESSYVGSNDNNDFNDKLEWYTQIILGLIWFIYSAIFAIAYLCVKCCNIQDKMYWKWQQRAIKEKIEFHQSHLKKTADIEYSWDSNQPFN